jgi:hypothetical protein
MEVGMRYRPIALAVAVVVATMAAPLGAQEDQEERSPQAQLAIAHLRAELGDAALRDVVITDEYTSTHNDVTHVYLRQAVNGTPVVGNEATVNVQRVIVDEEEKLVVLHAAHQFSRSVQASGSQQISPDEAVRAAAAAVAVDSPNGDPRGKPQVAYRSLPDGTARLAYMLEIVDEHHWWYLAIDAENGDVLHVEDWVDHDDVREVAASTARPEHAPAVEAAIELVSPPKQVKDGSSYRVFPVPMDSPLDGGRYTVYNPADADASPWGWHDTNGQPGPEYTTTRGNNVNAYADTHADNTPDPNSQPNGGTGLDFDFPILTYDATPAVYRDAAVTNLFYMNNVMHDVTFRYGFDEQAGNFQETNYTGRGRGADPVLAEAQDGSFVLNANFATPVDGESGRMQMFLWVDAFRTLGLRVDDVVRPYSHQVRDGDLDNGVIAHEYGHGVSNRLVGGPSYVSCLRTHDERQGEGWSDWWSYALTTMPGDDGTTPRGVGNYVVYYDEYGRNGPGVRTRPYSTDMRINDHTYNSIRTAAEPHGVGEVWATMLWDLYWNLIDKYGFNPNVYEGWDTGGNNYTIQLVVDGMKMAPCEPGFVDARNAIIAADQALTGNAGTGEPGDNECLIWRTFARRGLGWSADQRNPHSKTDGIEGYDVPPRCATG